MQSNLTHQWQLPINSLYKKRELKPGSTDWRYNTAASCIILEPDANATKLIGADSYMRIFLHKKTTACRNIANSHTMSANVLGKMSPYVQ